MSSVALLIPPRLQFTDANGKPLAGGKVFTYQAGTTTPQATFVDSLGIIQNSNPVILDGGGFANIWLGPQSYKILVQNSLGVQQWVVDNVQSFNGTITGTTNLTGTLTSSSANPATAGFIRMANGDIVRVRNVANTLDLAVFSFDSSDRLTLGDTPGVKFPSSADVVGITPAPALSSAGQARLYFDSVLNKLLYSENAGAFKVPGGVMVGSLMPTAAAIVGTSGDATYFTWTLPAKLLFAGSGIRVVALSKHGTGAASISFRLSFGGTFTTALGFAAANGVFIKAVYEIWNNAGVTNAQSIVSSLSGDSTTATKSFFDTAAIDTTAAVTINATFNVANTDQLTPEIAWIEHIGTN